MEAQFYNGTHTPFGKNRIQYDHFEWQFYRFEKFETYFYTGGKEFAVHTAKYANTRVKKWEKLLDFYLDAPLQFIIFNKQSHFRQSNIGLASGEDYNIGGVTQLVDDKVFLFFEGDYEKLNRQIDAGILRVILNQMMYGGNWKDVLKNSALMNVPLWYSEGLISYLTFPNNAKVYAQLQDGILNDRYRKFNTIDAKSQITIGHSMWEYIANTYGTSVLSNILYMTRVSRRIDDGYLFVVGLTFDDIYTDWLNNKRIEIGNIKPTKTGDENLSLIKTKKNTVYQNFSISPDEQFYAYSTNSYGQIKIFIHNIAQNKKVEIYKQDHKLERIQDYSFPIVNWHPSGKRLSFIVEYKGNVMLHHFDLEERTLNAKPILRMEKVLSFDYSSNGKQIVFSGVFNSQTDLYMYKVVGNTQKKLTDDLYDDLDPIFIEKGTKIAFVSNRNNDSLNLPHKIDLTNGEKDIFTYSLEDGKVEWVSNTIDEQESNPINTKNGFAYLGTKEGITKRYFSTYDSTVSHIDTTVHYNYFYTKEAKGNASRNLLYQSGKATSETIGQINFFNGRYDFSTLTIAAIENNRSDSSKSEIIHKVNNRIYKNPKPFDAFPNNTSKDEGEVNIKDYPFNSTQKKEVLKSTKNVTDNTTELDFPTQRIYKLNFKPDNSVLQLNNTFLNGQYQPFNGGPFVNQGLGVGTRIGIVDLMENHRIYGGFRYSNDLTEYSLTYQNLKHRLDREYTLGRTKQNVIARDINTGLEINAKLLTLKANANLNWPLSETKSFRGVAEVRNDKFVPLLDQESAIFRGSLEIQNEYWGSLKLAYVFDNTRDIALNIKNGSRYKFFAEQYQLAFSTNENTTKSDFTVLGFDARHYQKLHREFTWVGRIAGSTSFGSNPVIYYLGGVDDWWKSDIYDESTPVINSKNFGFQGLAANMRGFLQNIRNGNNFVVVNSELRLPIFSYFIQRPIHSQFVKTFQLIGFSDVGTAWIGSSPFSDENPISNESINVKTITVTYEDINNPIVGGVGFGMRAYLLGYFMRADWAWGIENGNVSKESMFIFSLSLDI